MEKDDDGEDGYPEEGGQVAQTMAVLVQCDDVVLVSGRCNCKWSKVGLLASLGMVDFFLKR